MIFRRIRHVLGTLNFVILLLAAIFGACLWYFGPLLHWGDWRPLDTVTARVVAIVVVVVLAFLIIVLR